MSKFDPNAAASPDSGVFGLPGREADAALVYLPVPWEATTSYGGGTSLGPAAILEASRQVDLYDLDVHRPYEAGLFMLEESEEVRRWNNEAKDEAARIIEAAGVLGDDKGLHRSLARVNELGEQLNRYVYGETRRLLDAGKVVGVVGGDHSVPFGALQAVAEKNPKFGILHFDAHSDTRRAYEGFTWSHASIMQNVLTRIPQVIELTQVGIRDFCEEELDFCRAQGERVRIFFDRKLAGYRYGGAPWEKICAEILARLPEEVWISFDIDGLDPRFCPHTGTPVPGGLDYNEAAYLIAALAKTGRKIVGFDLNEVAPAADENDEWDANVGARLLYQLSAWTLYSQGKARLTS